MLRNIILNTLKRLFIASLLLLCAYTNLVLTKEITQKSPSELSENVDDAISHAFIQTGSEIYYLVDDEAVWASVNDLNEEYSLNINPRDLNFGESFIGVPNKMTVNIFNPTEKIFKFEKIAGSSSHFHASFPKKTELKPNEATTFDVYFLARSEKLIEGIITVKSNKGIIKLGVKGEGLRSPYRLRSNIMAILPMNGTFTAPINLHNPHSKILKVTEIISSSNDLQLELPNGRIIQDIAPDSWEIEPLQTKTLLMAKVLGSKEQNTLAFITLKATLIERNKKGVLKDRFSESFAESVPNRLILPVNINVEEKKALYATTDVFDFGYIKAGLKSKIEKILNVFSTLAKSVDVESVYYEPNDKKHSMHIGYPSNSQRSISPSLDNKPGSTVPVAAISMNSVAYNDYVTGNYKEPNSGETFVSGKIILLTKGGLHNVSVPYIGRIYTGELYHSVETVSFHNTDEPPKEKLIYLINALPFGISIRKVQIYVNHKEYFHAELIKPLIHLAAGAKEGVVKLKYLKKFESITESMVLVYTNLTSFEIPIKFFDGHVDVGVHALDPSVFDFGTLSPNDERSIHFWFKNKGNVPVPVEEFTLPLDSHLKISYTGRNSTLKHYNVLPEYHSPPLESEFKEMTINANGFTFFKITLNTTHYSSLNDMDMKANLLKIKTKYQTFEFPIKFSISPGGMLKMPPTKSINFGKVFPGMVVSKRIFLFNHFPQRMNLIKMAMLSGDKSVRFENPLVSNTSTILMPGKITDLGRALYNPQHDLRESSYLGLEINSVNGQWFVYGMKLPQNLAEIDVYLYKLQRNKFDQLVEQKKNIVEDSLIVDTDHVKSFQIPTEAELVWPRLLTRSTVHFPLTAINNFSIINLTIQNPSIHPVLVQLLPLVLYPDAESFLHLFKNDLPAPLTNSVETNETIMFSLRDTELFTLKPDSPVPKLREQVETLINSPIPRYTLSMLLQPGMKVRIRLGFLPIDRSLRSSLLIIRNNLTIIEPVVLYGRGATLDMQIENKRARTRAPLLFEIQSPHLTDCDNPKRQSHKLTTTLTVKRVFTVRNTGEIIFTVTNISINNYPCENRGFKVLNCEPFTLKPYETHTLEIAYTPDFLMTFNEAALQLYMPNNGTSWLFPIAASVPQNLLGKCHAALPRPPFEGFMYWSCITALMFCLICVIACSYLEGDRTIIHSIRLQYSAPKKVFNLKDINSENMTVDLEMLTLEPFKTRVIKRVIGAILYICQYIWPARFTSARLGESSSSGKNKIKSREQMKKAQEEEFKLLHATTLAISKDTFKVLSIKNPGLIDSKNNESKSMLQPGNNILSKLPAAKKEEIKENIGVKIANKKKKGNKKNHQNGQADIVQQASTQNISLPPFKNKEPLKEESLPITDKIDVIVAKVSDNKTSTKSIQNGKHQVVDKKSESRDFEVIGNEEITACYEPIITKSCSIKSEISTLPQWANESEPTFENNDYDAMVSQSANLFGNDDICSNADSETPSSVSKESVIKKVNNWADNRSSFGASGRTQSPVSETSLSGEPAVLTDQLDLLRKNYEKEVANLYKTYANKEPGVDEEQLKKVTRDVLTLDYNIPEENLLPWGFPTPASMNSQMQNYEFLNQMMHTSNMYGMANNFMSPMMMNPMLQHQQMSADPWSLMNQFNNASTYYPPELDQQPPLLTEPIVPPSTSTASMLQPNAFSLTEIERNIWEPLVNREEITRTEQTIKDIWKDQNFDKMLDDDL